MKGFGTLYVFELKKVLGQRLLLVSVLLGAALLFGWNLLTFYGTGYYYRYHAQTNSVERLSRPYREVENLRRDSMRALAGQELDEPLMEELIGQYRDDETGTVLWNLNSYSPFLYLNTMGDRTDITAEGFYAGYLRVFDPAFLPLTAREQAYWQEMAGSLDPLTLDYAGGWQAMAQNCGLLCQVTVLLTAVCLCRLFSQEHRTRTDQLVLSSTRGKTVAFWARWAAGSFRAVCAPILCTLWAGRVFHRPSALEPGVQLPSASVHGRVCPNPSGPAGAGLHSDRSPGHVSLRAAAQRRPRPGGPLSPLWALPAGPVLRTGPPDRAGFQLPALLPHQPGHLAGLLSGHPGPPPVEPPPVQLSAVRPAGPFVRGAVPMRLSRLSGDGAVTPTPGGQWP